MNERANIAIDWGIL